MGGNHLFIKDKQAQIYKNDYIKRINAIKISNSFFTEKKQVDIFIGFYPNWRRSFTIEYKYVFSFI